MNDVIPSHLQLRDRSSEGTFALDNVALRLGVVVKVLYPDDKDNVSKRFVEYNVLVQHRSNGTAFGKLYNNCYLMNLFGGLADKEVWTLRVQKEDITTKNVDKTEGSKVLLACINGEALNAVIIGGIRDQNDEADKNVTEKDNGHYYSRVFNGIDISINKDGEYIITYKGATKADGKTDAKDEVVGTFFKLDKDGNASISDKDGKNSVTINHKDKKVVIKRDEKFELGEASDEMLLGKSFRDAQKQMHNKMKAKFKTLKNLLQQAGTFINTASSTPIPPGGTLGTLAPAGAVLISAANIAEQIGQDIDDFEQAAGQKNGFLSKKNKAD